MEEKSDNVMRRIALWGQHLDEYRDMFGLTAADLSKNFLEYNSGASAFNAELSKLNTKCISCDPWFDLELEELAEKINTNFNNRLKQLENNLQNIDVSRYGSFAKLIAYRRQGIAEFLQDFVKGKDDKRYIGPQGASLPFADFSFDFAVVANNFFADLDYQTVEYHVAIIKELGRVAKDVRIFPLVDVNGVPSSLLGPIIMGLHQDNFGVEVKDVAYHLQPKGNAMLRVWAQQCQV